MDTTEAMEWISEWTMGELFIGAVAVIAVFHIVSGMLGGGED